MPKTQMARSDLMAMTIDQIVIRTIRTETTSIIMEMGLTHFGCLMMTFFSIVFFTSSLKLVSHFWRRTFLKTQCQAFLKTAHHLLPMSRLKILRKATITDTKHRIINAAIQTIYLLYHHGSTSRRSYGLNTQLVSVSDEGR